jgi:hypothetical protein
MKKELRKPQKKFTRLVNHVMAYDGDACPCNNYKC